MRKFELTKIYRLREKETGIFHVGGRSANAGVYTDLSAIKGLFTRHRWLDSDDYDVVEYLLVENNGETEDYLLDVLSDHIGRAYAERSNNYETIVKDCLVEIMEYLRGTQI